MQRPKSIVVVITGQVQAEKVQLRVCKFLDVYTPLLPLDRCCDRQALTLLIHAASGSAGWCCVISSQPLPGLAELDKESYRRGKSSHSTCENGIALSLPTNPPGA